MKKADLVQRKLQAASAGIAGAGGLGSNAAIALARAGIGRLVIVDFDIVEKSNIDRQYYFLDQVGRRKVDALKETIQHINPKITVETHPVKLKPGTMDALFHNVDVVIEALDGAEIKTAFIEEVLSKLPHKPLIAASGVAGYGQCDRIHTVHSGKLHLCYDEQACSSDDDILTAPRVALMANWEANLALELILGDSS